jgi:hypothetical protein
MATKNNPGRYDCYKNAHPDEPYFMLLGRDATAPLIVLAWIALRLRCGFNDPEQLQEAFACAVAMQAWAIERCDKRSLVSRAKAKAIALVTEFASSAFSDAMAAEIEEKLDGMVEG